MIYYHKSDKEWYETWAWPKADVQIYVETLGHVSASFKRSLIIDEWNYEYIVSHFDYEEERFVQAADHQLETLVKMIFNPKWTIEDQRPAK
jgi:hypothetical protein